MTKLFQIVLNDKGVITPCPQFGTYTDGKSAAEFAKAVSVYGSKYQVRPVELEEDWREREAKIVAECPPLPWAKKLPPITDHFARQDADDKGYIRFIQSEEEGKIGRHTVWAADTYLSRFYPDVHHYERHKLVRRLQDVKLGEVKLAWTEDEIQRVYDEGPTSCMSRDLDRYVAGSHPARSYAAGDLAIAYVENESGYITHRALVWPEKKIYGRVYGYPEEDLAIALEDMGYRWSNVGFNGARLLKVELSGHYEDIDEGEEVYLEGYRVPYLDVIHRVRESDCGNYLIMDMDGNIDGMSTNGVVDYDGWTLHKCTCCSKKTGNVHWMTSEKMLCQECLIKTGELCCVSGRNCPDVELADGRRIHAAYKHSHTFLDPQTGLRHLIHECEEVASDERIAA